MALPKETVLYYYPKGDKQVTKRKSIFVRMGIRIKTIRPEQFQEKVGFLAGREGFEKAGETKDAPSILEEVLVMDHFSSQRMDLLLGEMRRQKLPKIGLKAVVTSHNTDWTFYELYQELKKEREQIEKGEQSVHMTEQDGPKQGKETKIK